MEGKGMDDVCEMIFQKHFVPRRTALLRALTQELHLLVEKCDSTSAEHLCLYAYSEGTWDVKRPEEHLSCNPEPYIGVNKKMMEMNLMEWIPFAARWSDSWLMSYAFFMEPHLRAEQRAILFAKINSLKTLVEETQKYYTLKKISQSVENVYNIRKFKFDGASDATHMEPAETMTCSGGRRNVESEKTNENYTNVVEDNQLVGVIDETGETEEDYCGKCNGVYKDGQFWIMCDACNRWYHGRCVNVNKKKSEDIEFYKCPECREKERPKKRRR